MRVLFLSQIVPYPPHGGVLQRGYHVVRQLGGVAQVHLLAFVHPDVLPTDAALEEGRAALRGFCESVEYFPLWAKTSSLHKAAGLAMSACSSRPFSMIAHRSQLFRRRVGDLIEKYRFDVVHVDTLALAQFVNLAVRVPKALTHHNIESMLMERRAEVEPRWLARRFLQRESAKLADWESRLSPRFDVNIMMSAHDERTLRGRAPNAVTAVVANGVDIDYFTPDNAPETSTLVYTGGMNMFANRDAVVYFLNEIWPLICAETPDVRFVAVGQDPPKELMAFAARDSRVVFTGYVPDIRPYVRQAAVYVVPLRVGGGTRLKVLDAMASGKAMVSTSLGCEGIDVTTGVHLITADTPEAFARATLTLLADPPRRQILGRAARDLVERRYSWPVIGRQLLEAYRMAVTNGRQTR